MTGIFNAVYDVIETMALVVVIALGVIWGLIEEIFYLIFPYLRYHMRHYRKKY